MDIRQEVNTAGLSTEKELAIYRQMLELNKEIAFEWDLKTDNITCSPRWEERFGYPFGTNGVGKFAMATAYFHPDDLEGLHNAIDQLRQGIPTEDFVLRVLDSGGNYLWNRIRAVVRSDAAGVPETIVGLMSDIDNEQQTSRALRIKAEQDSLTGLGEGGSQIDAGSSLAHAAFLVDDCYDFCHRTPPNGENDILHQFIVFFSITQIVEFSTG